MIDIVELTVNYCVINKRLFLATQHSALSTQS